MEKSNLIISHVDVNGRLDAFGIDQKTPVFHYTTLSTEKEKAILAYRVVVRNLENDETVWDSGKQAYAGMNYIEYSGSALKAKTAYQVQIQIWDEKDVPSEIATVTFETGFLDEPWDAKWIEPSQEPAVQEETLDFFEMLVPNPKFWGGEKRLRECQNVRKKISVDKPLKKARIYASAHGIYQLYINGKTQSNRRFAPENSAYQKMIYYQSYDVTEALKQGENEISMTLADGWWIGRLGLSGESCNYGDRLGCILQLEMTYEDGTTEIIGSDESFESQGSYIRYSDLYIGECQDFTMRVDNSNSTWKPCSVITEKSEAKLVAQPSDAVVVTDVLQVKKLFRTPKGELVADFGQVIAGVVRAKVKGTRGQVISFEHGEVLDREGNYQNNIIGRNKDQKDVLICTEGEQTFEPKFTFHGFRYVRITGAQEADILSLEALVMGTPIQPIGYFRCSDKKLNKLHHNIQWSERGNMFSVPTDCPQREKLGWTGDIQVFTPTGSFLYDLRNFLSCWLANVRAEQAENGEIPVTVPNPPKQEKTQRLMSGGSNSSAVWGDACVLVPWYLYEAYGDISVLKENYEMMKRWMDYIQSNCALKPEGYANFTKEQKERNPYLWTKQYHFGDWLVPSLRSLPDGVQRGTNETSAVVGSSYYAVTSSYFAKVCRALDKTKEAEKYEALIPKIQKAVREEFVSDDGIVNQSNLQGLYVIVLKAGIVEGELKKTVVENLVRLIRENGDCLDTGFSSVSYLLDVLADNGHLDLAYKLLYQTKSPSWLYMVEQGATTIWENWNAITPDGTTTDSSYNHYAFGCVGDWMYRHIGGIQKADVGYRKIIFAPDVEECGLTRCECALETPYGKTSLKWEEDGDTYNVEGIVPVGCTATLRILDQNIALSSGAFRFSLPEK